MVGLHVVHHDIVKLSVAEHLAQVLKEGHEKVHLDGVDKAGLLVVDKIGVIAHAVGQGPKALEERLVAVVDAYVVDVLSDLFHNFLWLLMRIIRPMGLMGL